MPALNPILNVYMLDKPPPLTRNRFFCQFFLHRELRCDISSRNQAPPPTGALGRVGSGARMADGCADIARIKLATRLSFLLLLFLCLYATWDQNQDHVSTVSALNCNIYSFFVVNWRNENWKLYLFFFPRRKQRTAKQSRQAGKPGTKHRHVTLNTQTRTTAVI